jgi:hypothetical protein
MQPHIKQDLRIMRLQHGSDKIASHRMDLGAIDLLSALTVSL